MPRPIPAADRASSTIGLHHQRTPCHARKPVE
jgi:hypothetical protein